ncbi:sulfotransferase [Glycomyces sp. TRM65418]|uniref:sulfotransferase family protein n=1 Tax=Glycomyces sp. TRM65418 TaxID=2867006 RepID=UPI001CE5B88A|nr:sulfotransferase [Glycomyces sp. TRM65418]MCC3765074.1 sulfotransferase [Glycomyces sp. TRM65418]QZD54703.1 sulfotransferase [Glycomyces sp. TRM65418]
MSRTTLTASIVNAALAPASGGRKRPKEAWAKAVEQVEKATGWSTKGEEQFVADLGFHLRCLADEPKLTPFGWQSAIGDAKARLENRLRIRERIIEHPEIADEPIVDPVFVVGLPRTATTLAHKILAASDDHRGPLLWEMLRTDVPIDPAEAAKTIKMIDSGARMMVRFAPSWEVIHPIRSTAPEESMFILPHHTYHLALRAALPEYRAWLGERDYTADYVYLRRALQVLQYGRERKRWTLKYPAHLNDLEVIRKVFPDAKFVWTHRDPSTVMGSVCSLMETSWSLYQRRPDLRQIGEVALGLLTESIERGRQSRQRLPGGSIVDVPYHRLNSDPVNEVPKLYEALNAKWTEKDAANLENVLARPQADRRHEYTLSRYGLDIQSIEDAFGDYTALCGNFNTR